MGIHHASSMRSVAAPRLMAISIASPVSPGLVNDHSALLGCSPEYFSRMAPLRENPPALSSTPPRARTRTRLTPPVEHRPDNLTVLEHEFGELRPGPHRHAARHQLSNRGAIRAAPLVRRISPFRRPRWCGR